MSSSSNPVALIMVDTNLLLHFKRLDQIDWSALAQERVRLIILPVVVRELEKHKTFHQNAKVRDRAGKVITWFNTLADTGFDVDLSSSLALRFHTHEPAIDFSENKLTKELQDDVLVAGVLSLQQEEGEDVSIATADFGLKLKARQRRIPVVVPPERDRLADEPDARDKELATLRKENLQLANRVPKLSLVFAGSTEANASFVRPVEKEPPASLAMVQARHPRLGETPTKRPLFELGSSLAYGHVSADSQKRYNEKLDEYFEKYAAYLESHSAWAREALGRFQLELVLRNGGTTPATNIDVTFAFPEDVLVLTEVRAVAKPKPPDAPKIPTPLDYLHSLGLGRPMPGDYLPRSYEPRTSLLRRESFVSSDGNLLRFHSDRLKQTMAEDLDKVWFQFAHPDEVRSFTIEATMSANEIPGEVKQTLSVIIN